MICRMKHPKRKAPVHIPMAFNDALKGLLAVDPKQLPKQQKNATKSQQTKNAARRKKGT